MSLNKPSTERVLKAERAVIRSAMGIVNAEGWAFQTQGDGRVPVVLFPGAMRRLEFAIQRLRAERKLAKRQKRK